MIILNSSIMNKRNYHVNFTGNTIYTDIGASTPDGSCKQRITNENGTTLNSRKTIVNSSRTGKFKSNERFTTAVADRIAEFQPKDSILDKLYTFVPGATYGDEIIKTPNLKDAHGEGLHNIDFSKIPSLLKQRGIKISKNFKNIVLQDSMGIGLSVLQNMTKLESITKDKKSKLLYPGASYTAIMTGGGCGISQIDVIDKNHVLVKGAGSNYLTDADKAVRVSDIGASVKATLESFGKWFGFSENQYNSLVNSGIGQVITDTSFTIENNSKTQGLKNTLEKTEKYLIKETPENISFKIKDKYLNEFKEARFEAISNYASAIARFLPVRLAEGSSGLILTGPFAFALDDCLKKDYKTNLPNLIKKRFTPYSSGEYKSMMDKYNFNIICDKANFAVSDNTDCAPILRFAKTIGKRRNWLMVNVDSFIKLLKAPKV